MVPLIIRKLHTIFGRVPQKNLAERAEFPLYKPNLERRKEKINFFKEPINIKKELRATKLPVRATHLPFCATGLPF